MPEATAAQTVCPLPMLLSLWQTVWPLQLLLLLLLLSVSVEAD